MRKLDTIAAWRKYMVTKTSEGRWMEVKGKVGFGPYSVWRVMAENLDLILNDT